MEGSELQPGKSPSTAIILERNQQMENASEDGGSWWGSWGQQWIDSVKEKSAETLQMVKKDLNEFVEVIQGDTAEKLSETAAKLNETDNGEVEVVYAKGATSKIVKKGISKLLHTVSDLMTVEPDDYTEEVVTLADDRTYNSQHYSRKQEKLHLIQTDPGTYCNEPEGLFGDWLQTFDLDEQKLEMSDLLIQNTAVRAIYTQLVPNVISHTTFWQRYFFRLFLLDREEKKRNDILARANTSTSKDDDSTDGWGDDDDEEDDDIEVLLQSPYKEEPKLIDDINKLTMEEVIKHSQDQEKLKKEVPKSKNVVRDVENNDVDVTISVNVVQSNCNSSRLKQKLEPSEKTNAHFFVDDRNKSHETLASDKEFAATNCQTIDNSANANKIISKLPEEKQSSEMKKVLSPTATKLSPVRVEISETSSLSSWMSIDDDMKVKKIKEAQVIPKPDSNGNSEGKTSDSSSGVLINKSDIADDSDDFDLDLEDDVNEEELQKIVQEIKNKTSAGDLQDIDDDDWENWE